VRWRSVQLLFVRGSTLRGGLLACAVAFVLPGRRNIHPSFCQERLTAACSELQLYAMLYCTFDFNCLFFEALDTVWIFFVALN
jgi:hypothetical protein